jgi:hypothetical protein
MQDEVARVGMSNPIADDAEDEVVFESNLPLSDDMQL